MSWLDHNHLIRVQMFESNGEFCKQIGSKGEDPGLLMYPYGVAVDDQDNLFVCDLGYIALLSLFMI